MIVLEYISYVIGGIGVAIVIWGIIKGLIALILAELKRYRKLDKDTIDFEDNIRLGVGFYLILGLEFLVAADIIRTIINPTLEELGVLGGIVAIRIALAYFLGRELTQLRGKKGKYTEYPWKMVVIEFYLSFVNLVILLYSSTFSLSAISLNEPSLEIALSSP